MNKHELKEYIKSRIRERLYAGPSSVNPAKADSDYGKLKPQEKGEVEKTLRMGGSVELEEMARPAIMYKVADDFKEKAKQIKTGGPISPVKLADTLKFLEGKSEINAPQIAIGLGFFDVDEKGNKKAKVPRIYPIFAALIDAGAITATEDSETEEVEDTPVNKNEEDLLYSDVYDKSAGEPEEDEFEKEPEMGSIEKTQTSMDPVSKAASDFTLDNDDLIQSIIRAYKESRTRLGNLREEEGDLSAADYKKALKQSKEAGIERLSRKIDELVSKIQDLDPKVQDKVLKFLDFRFKSVDATGLSKTIAKKLGVDMGSKAPENPEDIDIIDIEDDELTEDSGVEDVDHDDNSFKDYDSVYERMLKKLKK
jgi:hypothetical protein